MLKKNHKSFKNNYKTMLSGSFCLKEKGKLIVFTKKFLQKKFNDQLEDFTYKKIKILNHKKINKKIKINEYHLKSIKKKYQKIN